MIILSIKAEVDIEIRHKVINEFRSKMVKMPDYTFIIDNENLTEIGQITSKQVLNNLGTQFERMVKKYLKMAQDSNIYIHQINMPTLTMIFTDENSEQYRYIHTGDVYSIDPNYMFNKKNEVQYETFTSEFEDYLKYWADYVLDYNKMIQEKHDRYGKKLMNKIRKVLRKEE